eukprot:5828116-Prymnesium_polylepis.2
MLRETDGYVGHGVNKKVAINNMLWLTLAGTSPAHIPGYPPGWNKLSMTPPLGWRSWNAWGARITQVCCRTPWRLPMPARQRCCHCGAPPPSVPSSLLLCCCTAATHHPLSSSLPHEPLAGQRQGIDRRAYRQAVDHQRREERLARR